MGGILGKPAGPRVPGGNGGAGGDVFEEQHARDRGGKFTSGADANQGPADTRSASRYWGGAGTPQGDHPPGELAGGRMGRAPRRPVRGQRMGTAPSRTQVTALQRLMRESGAAPGLMDDGDLGPVTLGEFTRIRDTLGLPDAAATVDMLTRFAALQGVTPTDPKPRRRPTPGGKP